MIGVIDVGGGLRGIFGAGVLDYCIDKGIHFDYGIGVSAGAANIASYQAGQRDRNYRFYTVYDIRREAMSWYNFFKSGSYIDLDYIYGDLTRQGMEDPLDFDAIMREPAPFVIVATDAASGRPHYFTKHDMAQDDYAPIAASSCVPVVDKPYLIDGIPYYDGGISDPIPYKKALDDGCDRLVIILTRPKDEFRRSGRDEIFARILRRSYEASAEALSSRSDTYNAQLSEIMELENEGKVLIVAPDDIRGMKTLNKDVDAIKSLYRKGLVAAQNIEGFINL